MSEFYNIKDKTSSLRLRTIILTSALIIGIIFYSLFQWIINDSLDITGLIIAGTLQLLTHFSYFEDGKIYGQRDNVFELNKKAYNDKANKVNDEKQFAKLKIYSRIEYEERKSRYLNAKFSLIGISNEDFELLKQKSEKEIKKLKKFENNGKIIFFTKKRRKALYNLIFKPLPIEPNEPEYIMSAVSFEKSRAIKDKSSNFEKIIHTKTILKVTILAVFIAYVGITLKNFSWVNIIDMFFYIIVVITTAIFSFSYGEKYTKIYKCNFYNELTMFLDGFFEYLENNPNKFKTNNFEKIDT